MTRTRIVLGSPVRRSSRPKPTTAPWRFDDDGSSRTPHVAFRKLRDQKPDLTSAGDEAADVLLLGLARSVVEQEYKRISISRGNHEYVLVPMGYASAATRSGSPGA